MSSKNQTPNLGKMFRTNQAIKSEEVRVISSDGQMVGVLPIAKAIEMAQDAGLDLIEVSPQVNPPVCKISNFGKMRYEMQKKASDAKKKQKVVDTKEVKMSFNIGKADYDFKIRNARKFIDKGNKVKISIRMKGREITHVEIAKDMMNNVVLDTEDIAKPEVGPRLEGMQMVVILVKK